MAAPVVLAMDGNQIPPWFETSKRIPVEANRLVSGRIAAHSFNLFTVNKHHDICIVVET